MNKNTTAAAVVVIVLVLIGLFVLMGRTAPADQYGQPSATTTAAAGSGANVGGNVGKPNPTPTPAPTPTSFTVAPNQIGGALGVTITPLTVLEDSRCPKGVQCIQAGTVRVNTSVTVAGTSAFSNQFTLGQPTSIVGGWLVTLTDVTPAAIPGGKPVAANYRFTFKIEKK